MQRQCAWCLRLMDRSGEPVSIPLAKRYEVSHGMCRDCGALWLEQVLLNTAERESEQRRTLVSEIKKDG